MMTSNRGSSFVGDPGHCKVAGGGHPRAAFTLIESHLPDELNSARFLIRGRGYWSK